MLVIVLPRPPARLERENVATTAGHLEQLGDHRGRVGLVTVAGADGRQADTEHHVGVQWAGNGVRLRPPSDTRVSGSARAASRPR